MSEDIVERLNYCGGKTDARFMHVPSRSALLLEAAAEITRLRDVAPGIAVARWDGENFIEVWYGSANPDFTLWQPQPTLPAPPTEQKEGELIEPSGLEAFDKLSKEVMPNNPPESGPHTTTPRPAHSQVGAEAIHEAISIAMAWQASENGPDYSETRRKIEQKIFAALTPPQVTDEMMERAAKQIHYDMGCTITAARLTATRVLTAALGLCPECGRRWDDHKPYCKQQV